MSGTSYNLLVDVTHDNLVILPMAVGDLDEVMLIEEYSFPTPWQRTMYENDIANNKFSRFFVLKDKDTEELVAYIGTWFIYEEAHVGTIASKNEYRGKRLAEQPIFMLITCYWL